MPKGKPIAKAIKDRALKALKVPGATLSGVANELKTSVSNVRRWQDAKNGKNGKNGKKGKKARKGVRRAGKPGTVIGVLKAEEYRLSSQLDAVRQAIKLLS